MSDKTAQKLARRFAQEDENDFHSGLAALLEHKHGRRFVWIHALALGLETEPIDSDTNMSYFRLGRKSAAEELLNHIRNHHHTAYLKLLEENHALVSERTQQIAAAGAAERQRDGGLAAEFRDTPDWE